ncbi:MAG: radical SAM protein [Sandaracinaceae bacterium]|nr:radical SAM protein [Sandaracinaceae bacterium]
MSLSIPVPVPRAGNQPVSPFRDPRRNVEINIGKTCNNKCVFCLDGMPTKEDKAFMPFEEMVTELNRYRAEGHLSVGFLGGEPTTYPWIVESVAHAKQLGFTRIALATNAMMLRREPFLDKLLDAGLTRTTISMHGHTAELEDKLTMVPGGFEKKCTAIRNLLARKRAGALADGVSVNIVLNGWNYRALPKMLKFFYETMGLDDVRVNFVRPEGYAEGNPDLTPTYSDVIPILTKAILLNEFHFKKTFTFGGVPMCVLPEELLRSRRLLTKYCGDIYRDLSTDCSIREGSPAGGSPAGVGRTNEGVSIIDNGRARFNWQDRKRADLKHQAESCQRCSMTDVCEGVWAGYTEIYGFSEFAPLEWEEGAVVRGAPRPAAAPVGTALESKKRFPRRLTVLQG